MGKGEAVGMDLSPIAIPRHVAIAVAAVLMTFSSSAISMNAKLDPLSILRAQEPQRDECIRAALCYLIKGDLLIETEGDDRPYYDKAMKILKKSEKYKKCPIEIIFTHCQEERLRCESDIDILARNVLRIPIDYLIACPYETWPYMMLSCNNYQNWPQEVNERIPQICRACRTQCHLLDEFEQIRRRDNLTDFPSNWEALKTFGKSRTALEKRQASSERIYPWVGLGTRSASDVVVEKMTHYEKHGYLRPKIFCPPGYFMDTAQQSFIREPGSPVAFNNNIRFGCSQYSEEAKNRSAQLWTSRINTVNETATCKPDEYIIGIKEQGTVDHFSFVINCGRVEDVHSDPALCPRYTAMCSVQEGWHALGSSGFYLLGNLYIGCCTVPKIIPECGNALPTFLIEPIKVQCVPLTNGLKNCSYSFNYGLIVGNVVNTTSLTNDIADKQAKLFDRIYKCFKENGPFKVRGNFKWTNVPMLMSSLAILSTKDEIVKATARYTRYQPVITCGNYKLRSMDQIMDFETSSADPAADYLKLINDGCKAKFQSGLIQQCKPATSCTLKTDECRKCEVNVTYGLFPPEGQNPSGLESANLYAQILSSFRQVNTLEDTNDWENVPSKTGLNVQTLTMSNIQFEIAMDLVQPEIMCISGTIRAKNTLMDTAFDGKKYVTRRFQNMKTKVFNEEMMVLLGCTPQYTEVRRSDEPDIIVISCSSSPFEVNSSYTCQVQLTVGYEKSGIAEETSVTLNKLRQIAKMALSIPNSNANLFNWEAVASVKRVFVKLPLISIINQIYGDTQALTTNPVIPKVTCGDYTLYADFHRDIGCILTDKREPILPQCTGCVKNPNFGSLPRQDYELYYTSCAPDAKCEWHAPYGYKSSDPKDTPDILRKKVDKIIAFGRRSTRPGHITPFEPLNWAEAAAAGGLKTQVVTWPNGFDRIVEIPAIVCGPITIYSKVHSYTLIM